jgi:DNA-binding response OmpR family regulator
LRIPDPYTTPTYQWSREVSNARPVVLAIATDALICGLLEDVFTVLPSYEVDLVDEPQTGLARAEAGSMNLIILDLGWPESNGLAFCGQLRALPQAAVVPIIALTDVPPDHYGVIGFMSGPNEYIKKPFHVTDLLAAIRRYCPLP